MRWGRAWYGGIHRVGGEEDRSNARDGIMIEGEGERVWRGDHIIGDGVVVCEVELLGNEFLRTVGERGRSKWNKKQ